jgi:hypothetical protein
VKVHRELKLLHPILQKYALSIQRELLDNYNMPFRLFETGRSFARQTKLVEAGQANSMMSLHFYNLEVDPPVFARAMSYVYYDGRWSWNIRDIRIRRWMQLFGELVLDLCPGLEWGGYYRIRQDYTYFQLLDQVAEG